MVGKQETSKGVAQIVLQDPHGKVKAKQPEAQFQEVSARLTGKTPETGTSSARGLKTSPSNSRN